MATRRKRTAYLRSQYCPNPRCQGYGKMGAENVVCNGSYRTQTRGLVRQFLCRACGETWTQHHGTFFHDLRTPKETILMALKLLVKGMPIRGIAEVLGVKPDTVLRWLNRAARHARKLTPMLLNTLHVKRTELDALFSFVKKNELRQRAMRWRARAPLGSVLPRRLG